ncbi:hypothetical protein DV711_06470 [Motiliproteus coralliicola]|uniref:Uncharacterized protein n=1 Tax=Motiliproteus coralliicola TaxID=2283196 RepID=A0A369WXD5_9GAMM|nr:hypothetical protein [Motiliproteus coralliicola]RDE25196.1 hypothetical protein DV711_06470 [Motiliproteus coralliicola]
MQIAEAVKGVQELDTDELEDFGARLSKEIPGKTQALITRSLVENMNSMEKAQVVKETAADLSDEDKTQIAQSLGLGSPTERTLDKLWKIAVWAFAIVMVGSFLFIAAGAFIEKPDTPIASGDILLSIFTASVGFFAGLFSPNPSQNG